MLTFKCIKIRLNKIYATFFRYKNQFRLCFRIYLNTLKELALFLANEWDVLPIINGATKIECDTRLSEMIIRFGGPV